jgi:hypothetical protein
MKKMITHGTCSTTENARDARQDWMDFNVTPASCARQGHDSSQPLRILWYIAPFCPGEYYDSLISGSRTNQALTNRRDRFTRGSSSQRI